jgi:ornithine--oxo-acid transaminase
VPPPTDPRELERRHGAQTYAPLPVVVAGGEGAWVTGLDGRRYLDFLSAYSALNFGHRHPRLVQAAVEQLGRVTLTSRAVHTDQLGPFCAELAELAGLDAVLPMNSGAEAVETALKLARKWGYRVKGVPPDRANVVVCAGNFHGRTITVVSFSDDPEAHDDYGPYTPGFRTVPYGDAAALAAAIDEDTVAFLVEPVQGEAGVIVPPAGYLAAARRICTERGVLLVADEIQTGLGRTGRTFACEHEGVRPDMYVLGKALGGGIVALSAVVARREVMDVLRPGQHGSTFGGNPLACAVGREVLRMLRDGHYQRRAGELGVVLRDELARVAPHVAAIRTVGLWAGIDLPPDGPPARAACLEILDRGVIVKDTHERTLRVAPPLVISEADLRHGLDELVAVLSGR